MPMPDPSLLTLGTLAVLGLFLTLAYVAEQEVVLRWVVLPALVLVDVLLVVAGSAYAMVGAVPTGAAPMPADPLVEVVLASQPALAALFVGLGLAGLALVAQPTRRLVARRLPIDPERLVHTAALHVALLLVAVSGMIAVVLSGVNDDPAALEELSRQVADQGGLAGLWAQNLGLVVLSLLGVGLFVRRDWRQVLERLGLTRHFRLGWWIGATALGLASGYMIDWLWGWLEPESLEQVSRLTDVLLGQYLEAGLASALTIGLAAGIGEEVVFRGAAQPRLGLLFTSFLFAALHTQYTVSPALIQMLIMGLLLGLVRRRVNTTTSIAVHATYNFILVALALYLPDLSP